MRDLGKRSGAILFSLLLIVSAAGGGIVIGSTPATGGPADELRSSADQSRITETTGTADTAAQVDLNTSDLSGNGTELNPYQISNASELQAIEDDLYANYILKNNIDASETAKWNNGSGFDPIGNSPFNENTSSEFGGTFDGQGYEVSNLTINRSEGDYIGVFGYSQGKIGNVSVVNATITGNLDVGVLVGYNDGANGIGKVARSSTDGNVSGSGRVGGLVGSNFGGEVSSSYTTAEVTGDLTVGGLIALNDGTVSSSYAVGKVDGGSRTGGLIGLERDTVTGAYWDTDSTGQSTSDGGTGLSTANMTGQSAVENMSEFDFNNTWTTTESYPELRVLSNTSGQNGGHGSSGESNESAQVDVGPDDLPGSGTEADPYQVSNASELQAIEDDLDANYTLVTDIDASQTAQWNNGSGFDPIGPNFNNKFRGVLDGAGHTIDGLTINRSAEDRVGLIGVLDDEGTVRNVSVADADITGNFYTGGLVGTSDGTVVSSSATGTVTSSSNNAGGLTGSNDGLLTESSAHAMVTGDAQIGGLVGLNSGIVGESYATGFVNASGSRAGGLVATNADNATVSSSYATGNVTGNSKIGGLAGLNLGTIEQTVAVGSVSGSSDIGGVVGNDTAPFADTPGTVEDSYFDEQATGQSTSAGNAVGLTTAQMTGESARTNMSGLDFNDTWTTTESYPELRTFSDTSGQNGGQDTAPAIFAPLDGTYDPSSPLTIGTGHNATGVINSSDVAVRLVNVTDGNNTVIAVNDSAPVEGGVNTTIPASSLAGNVTIETQLYNNSNQTVVATDIVNLTAVSDSDQDAAPAIFAPPDGEYNPTSPLTIGTGHNATGVINSSDVAIRLVNVTNGNNTVVAVNDSAPVRGSVNTTVPAESLTGNVTIEAQLYNKSNQSVVTTDVVNLTAAAPDTTDPVINGFSLLNESVAPGDTLVVEINATDASDIILSEIRLEGSKSVPSGFEGVDDIPFEKFNRTGLNQENIRFEIPIEDTQVNGTYNLESVSVTDAAGNVNRTFDDNGPSVIVSNPDADPETTSPEIREITALNETVEPGQQVAIEVNASDQSNITSIAVSLGETRDSSDVFNEEIRLSAVGDSITQNGTTRLTSIIPESQVNGEYQVDSVTASDEIGNDEFASPQSSESINITGVNITGGINITDRENPQVTDLNLPNAASAGGNITVGLNATDESRIVSVTIELDRQERVPFDLDDRAEIRLQRQDNDGLNETTRLEATVPDNQFNGTYEVDGVTVIDAARNTRFISSFDLEDRSDLQTGPIELQNGANVSKVDTSGPEITNVNIQNESVEVGSRLIVTADVSDQSGIKTVKGAYRFQATLSGRAQFVDARPLALSPEGRIQNNSTVTLSTTVPENTFSGQYVLSDIEATDTIGNEGTVFDFDLEEERVDVSGGIDPDTTRGRGEITDIGLLNESVAPGESVQIRVRTDRPVGFGFVSVGFSPVAKEPTPGLLPDTPDRFEEIEVTRKNATTVILQTTIPESSPDGTIQLESVNTELLSPDDRLVGQSLEIRSDSEPSITAPDDTNYDPNSSVTIRTSHNATGVINSSDVAVRLVNVTSGNSAEIALNDSESVPVAGEVNTTISGGTLSGNVTIETQLYNNSSQQAVATDTIVLTVLSGGEGGGDDGDDGDGGGGGGGGGDDPDTTPPVVSVDAPGTVNVSEPFSISASASTDNGTGIANYTFVVPGQTNTTQSNPQFETSFSENGTRNITVRVTDAAGNQNSTTIAVEVVQSADDGGDGGDGGGGKLTTTATETETGSEAPGFGPIVALAALFGVVLLAVRQNV